MYPSLPPGSLTLPARLAATLLLGVCAPSVTADDGVRRYGVGTPGSGNIEPTIWVNQSPRPGTSGFKLRIERALGGTWAFPFVSAQPGDHVYRGVRFLVDPTNAFYYGAFFLAGQGDGGGSGDVPMPLPNHAGLIGVTAYVQAFTLDDFAPNPLGIGATTGLRIEVTRPGQLLVAQRTASIPDPQTAIELRSGQTRPYEAAQIHAGQCVAFAQTGSVALALDVVAGRLRVYDTSVFPPVWRGNGALAGEGEPARIVATPDGSRGYVVHTGRAGTNPPIVAYDTREGATFGQVWPGAPIRLEYVPDACAMVFTRDNQAAFVVAEGTRSGGHGSLARIDANPSSATFHQVTARMVFDGRLATDLALAVDDQTVYVPLIGADGQSEIAVVDVVSFVERDMDPGTPGVQALGAEQSVPRTPLPTILGRVVVDPRGDIVYCATLGGILRVDVAPASPNFRRVTWIGDKLDPHDLILALQLAPAGETLYAATVERVVEFDAPSGLVTRQWLLPGVVDFTLR